VLCEYISEAAQTTIEQKQATDQQTALALIDNNPAITQPELAEKLGWKLHGGQPNKMRAKRFIEKLIKLKLVDQEGVALRLTNKGKKFKQPPQLTPEEMEAFEEQMLLDAKIKIQL
jgi:predicted HTH transcriptional regulator